MRKRGEPALKLCVTYVSDAPIELFVKIQAEYRDTEVNASFSGGFPSLTHSGWYSKHNSATSKLTRRACTSSMEAELVRREVTMLGRKLRLLITGSQCWCPVLWVQVALF